MRGLAAGHAEAGSHMLARAWRTKLEHAKSNSNYMSGDILINKQLETMESKRDHNADE